MIGPTTSICDFPVSRLSADENLTALLRAARSGRGGWVMTLNLEMLSRGAQDREYLALARQADAFLADGMPLVWAASATGFPIRGRTTGVDLVRDLLCAPDRPATAVIGGSDPRRALAVLGTTVEWLDDGRIDLSEAWWTAALRKLRAIDARLILVALGVPKQDLLAHRLRDALPQAVVLGVGGSFEMLSGEKPRAPRWMQQAGLEWAFRLTSEPGRLWKRYLLHYPIGGAWLLWNLVAQRRKNGR